MRNKILSLVAAICMTMGMKAQVTTVDASSSPEQVKAEAEANYQKGNAFWKSKETDKALAYYEKAANAGHAGAQHIMGLLYIEGKVFMQDYDKAVEWLEKAAIQGHKEAQFKLASMYHQGLGVEKDPQKAVFWAQKYKESQAAEAASGATSTNEKGKKSNKKKK